MKLGRAPTTQIARTDAILSGIRPWVGSPIASIKAALLNVRNQRWIYILLIMVGVVLGIGISGIPSGHYDPPIHIPTTTTTTTSSTSTQVP
jgi:hypothetical protein